MTDRVARRARFLRRMALALTGCVASVTLLAAPAGASSPVLPLPGPITIGPLRVDLRHTVSSVLHDVHRVSNPAPVRRPSTPVRRPGTTRHRVHPRPQRVKPRAHRRTAGHRVPAGRRTSHRTAVSTRRRHATTVQRRSDLSRPERPGPRTTQAHHARNLVRIALDGITGLGQTMLALIGASALLALLVLALVIFVGRRPDPRIAASESRLRSRSD